VFALARFAISRHRCVFFLGCCFGLSRRSAGSRIGSKSGKSTQSTSVSTHLGGPSPLLISLKFQKQRLQSPKGSTEFVGSSLA
jgi:hypothetical protein